jgi:dihydrofolate reductase
MRKIIVLSFISLDGVMQAQGGLEEDPSGSFAYGGWTVPYFDEFSGQEMGEQMSQPADLLLGRKTFEIFASYWPYHTEEWPQINEITKYVASQTLTHHEWANTVFLNGEVAAELSQLKQGNGPDLQVHGSSQLIQTLLAHDLIDELWLKIFPLTLGVGKRLFGQGVIPAAFNLASTKASPSGVILANYQRAGEVKTGSFPA